MWRTTTWKQIQACKCNAMQVQEMVGMINVSKRSREWDVTRAFFVCDDGRSRLEASTRLWTGLDPRVPKDDASRSLVCRSRARVASVAERKGNGGEAELA